MVDYASGPPARVVHQRKERTSIEGPGLSSIDGAEGAESERHASTKGKRGLVTREKLNRAFSQTFSYGWQLAAVLLFRICHPSDVRPTRRGKDAKVRSSNAAYWQQPFMRDAPCGVDVRGARRLRRDLLLHSTSVGGQKHVSNTRICLPIWCSHECRRPSALFALKDFTYLHCFSA